jgi:autotransporter strand-loop-strand O-heptosyltransferase
MSNKKLKGKDITVTISTKNRYLTTLPNCLQSIANQTVLPKRIILFNDGEQIDFTKDDGYIDILLKFQNENIQIDVIEGEKLGQVKNHQKALKVVKTKLIFRVDDDCVLETDVLETLLDTMDDDVAAVGCLVPFRNQKLEKNPLASNRIEDILLAQNEQWYLPENYDVKEVDHLYSTFLFRKRAGKHGYNMNLSQVGAGEETVFTHQMVRNGWRVLFNPNAKIWHHHEETGGIRDTATTEMAMGDNCIFLDTLKSWGVKLNYPERYLLEKDYIYQIDFIDGIRIQLFGEGDDEYIVKALTSVEGIPIIQNGVLRPKQYVRIERPYYQNWRVAIQRKDGTTLVEYAHKLQHKNVVIVFDSTAIGDTLAWIPYVEEFRKRHNCHVYCATFHNELFKGEYPEIHFIDADKTAEKYSFLKRYMDSIQKDVYSMYTIGWNAPWTAMEVKDGEGRVIRKIGLKNPNENKKIPLQQTSSDVLGLKYKEIRPKITIPNLDRPVKEKYVCISEFSTGYAKMWNYPERGSNRGWQAVVDWLNSVGYKVMVISKEPTELTRVIDHTGDHPLSQRVNELRHSDGFIGVSSALSWLAWGTGTQVVMISGFTKPWFEFQSGNIRVSTDDNAVCNGCWHNYDPERGVFDWCPRRRDYECTSSITPKQVIAKIKSDIYEK